MSSPSPSPATLNERAVLANLNVSIWSSSKLDKAISSENVKSKKAVTGSLRTHKSLLPECDVLARVKKKANAIRSHYYENTLPWGARGTRIMPTTNYMDFMKFYREEKDVFDRLASEFVAAYPPLVDSARDSLGDSYNVEDYPPPADIASKFSLDLDITPLPVADFRVSLHSDEIDRLKSDMDANLRKATAGAMRDVWQRLYDRVRYFSEKLSDPDATFRNTTVEHLRDLCGLLPALNIAGDSRLDELRLDVLQALADNSAEDLRRDKDLRRDSADKTKIIADSMAAYMGQ